MIEAGKFLQQRYRINKQIGQGGMGAVYVATDERFNSMVAIKETLCMDENFRKAIEREARLLNSLKHSALPRVSDHFVEDAGQFLVMEYIPGEDLYEILERSQKPFPVETVLTWADQLLEALDYLHTQTDPVIHRDIKPQNLKVSARGQIVLLDFGLAKGNPTDGGLNTAAKSIFGYSRNYASLEQIQGTGTDPRSDLYSLAATLYHLLTNTPPDDALMRAMSVLGHNGDPLKPANRVNAAIPAGVAGVLQKALALNAGERPSSAADLRQMFRNNEQYAYLAAASNGSADALATRIFAEPTRLMPEETQAGVANLTDLKTEVLPHYISQQTAVRQTGDSFPKDNAVVPKRRRFSLAAGLLSVLLAGGAVAGGFLIIPAMLEPGTPQTIEGDKTAAPAAETVLPEQNTEESVRSAADSPGETTTSPADGTHQPTTTTKQADTAAKNKKSASTEDANADEPDGIDVTMDENDEPESVTVTRRNKNGKVTTMRVNPNEHTPNAPEVPENFNPFPPGFDPSKQMTPAQRRQLNNLMRERIRRQIPKPQ
jgi:eukaryotic-like serine/threonine-protein kinase